MKRVCPACAKVIKEGEPYHICSQCKSNYHLSCGQCLSHPSATMLLVTGKSSEAPSTFKTSPKPTDPSPAPITPEHSRHRSFEGTAVFISISSIFLIHLISNELRFYNLRLNHLNITSILLTSVAWLNFYTSYSLSGKRLFASFTEFFHKIFLIAMFNNGIGLGAYSIVARELNLGYANLLLLIIASTCVLAVIPSPFWGTIAATVVVELLALFLGLGMPSTLTHAPGVALYSLVVGLIRAIPVTVIATLLSRIFSPN